MEDFDNNHIHYLVKSNKRVPDHFMLKLKANNVLVNTMPIDDFRIKVIGVFISEYMQ